MKFFWEKSNRYDPNAIRIELDGVKIGYVPKCSTDRIQEVMHEYRERGVKVRGTITAVNSNNPTWNLIVVKVEVPIKETLEDEEQDFRNDLNYAD